jgi:PKD repeat protein
MIPGKGKRILKKYFLYKFLILILLGFSSVSLSQVDDEFWFVVPELSHRGNVGGTPGTLRIATMELEATVTISMPANPYHPTLNPNGFQDIVVNIAGNSTAAVDLTHLIDVVANPTNNRLENKALTPNGINDFGLHITATNMITAYWEVNYDYGADLWTLKGSNGEGTLFYTPFQTEYDNRNLTPRTYSAIDIVSTQDNNQVTITLPPGIAASYGSWLTAVPAGGTHVVTLNRGQTFSLFPLNYSILAADRLAGTRIESTAPVCVTLKDDAVAAGSQGQDVVGDQIVPVDIIGSDYIVPEINNPNHVYVLATEDNTDIYVYGADGLPIGATPYVTLNRGQQGLVIVPGGRKYAYITSDDFQKPFYVFQMGLENQSRGGAIIPPIGCTGNTQLAFTRARADNKFYFFIIVERGNEDKFLIDGVRDDGIIDPLDFTEIPGSGGYMAWFSNSINSNILTVGQHLVQNTGGIFHLGILNGFPGAAQGRLYYGYYSDFGYLNIGANVAGTNSQIVRACYGDPVQLYAFGGTNYLWTPDTYLDDATSNMPTAINLPSGPHDYVVEVSGACGSDSVPITIIVSTPIEAFFETNVSSGCSPLEVQIDDQSSGVYFWQYDPGDGTPFIRYDLDPATPYPIPPNYPLPFSITHTYTNTTSVPINDTITLLVKNESGCADILRKTIIVYPEIHSNFSVSVDDGCDPLQVQFQNTSTGNTDTWLWEFGDGGSSIEENPQHVFRNLFGPDNLVFETSLVAISPYFCRDTITDTIIVRPYIEANFAFDTVSACTPHEIMISDQSIGADTYHWDFGDGTTSTSSGPKITKLYVNNTSDSVTYTIKLRVENEEGCFDEIERDVTVFPEIKAEFLPVPDEGCSPYEVLFQNNSTGSDFYFWDFGDGGTSTEVNPIHKYERNMMDHDTTYQVTMIATSTELCRDTDSYDMVVHPYIEAAFTVDDIIGCHPFTITVNNQSYGVDQYSWDFGDGSPVSNTNAASFDHTYLNTGNSIVIYPLQLIVLNNQGCRDTLLRNISVHPEMTASFTPANIEGCHPLTVSFTDLSLNAATYYWEFGDEASSVESSPTHTYTNFGTSDTIYYVTLTTSSADGECVKSVSKPIIVHPEVEAEFTFSKAIDCNPFEVTFEILSSGGKNYTWDFDDGTVINTSNTDPVTHTFVNNDFSNTRDFEVVLLVENDAGCTSEVRKTVSVYPDIESSFTASVTEGCHPLSIDFTNQSGGGNKYVWDFGDGASSDLDDPDHTFNNTGLSDLIYTVTLVSIAPNGICRDTSSVNITVHPYVQADFSMQYIDQCSPATVMFSNSSVNGQQYSWTFDGTPFVTANKSPITRQFTNSSYVSSRTFTVELQVTSPQGCTSTVSKQGIIHRNIEAAFSHVTEGCHPLMVDFTNNSQGADDYFWDFGDGGSSISQDPDHTFTNLENTDSVFNISLVTINSDNCKDTAYSQVTVYSKPKAKFTVENSIDCPPFEVTIQNVSQAGNTYYWDFGDGSTPLTTTDLSPVNHTYYNNNDATVTYVLKLHVESLHGCTDDISQNMSVYPSIKADFERDSAGCNPYLSEFTNNSLRALNYSWDFGDGVTSLLVYPTHTFTNNGLNDTTFNVTLTSTSKFGCVDSITKPVTVYPTPVAEFNYFPVYQYFPDATINLENETSDGYWDFEWDFGDGVQSTLEDPGSYTYSTWGTYNITLEASNANCQHSITHWVKIFAPMPRAAFEADVYEGCVPLNISFINNSIYSEEYYWDFGDGETSTEFEPVHTYNEDGLYQVRLTASGEGGEDFAAREVTAYVLPEVDFKVEPDLVMLPDEIVKAFNFSLYGERYLWDFGDDSTYTMENPVHLYTELGVYDVSLQVWTEHECTASKTIPEAVTVIGKGEMIFPNAFAPNLNGPSGGEYDPTDKSNQIFFPYHDGVVEYKLEIYSRWGELIFQTTDVNVGWDGYYKGQLCDQGVYIWRVSGKYSNNRYFQKTGDVTLLHYEPD